MTRFGWRTVAVRAEYLDCIEAWAAHQPRPPKLSQIMHEALRDWFDAHSLPVPATDGPAEAHALA